MPVVPWESQLNVTAGGVFTPAVRGAESAYKLTVISSLARRKSVVYSSGRDRAYEYLPLSDRYQKNPRQL
jgi:hypothetical protein